MLTKTQLPCCAICFLSGTSNNTTEQELRQFEATLRQEAFSKKWMSSDRTSGERAILTVTTQDEKKLAELLKKIGFVPVSQEHLSRPIELNRRFGYIEGNLTLWILNF